MSTLSDQSYPMSSGDDQHSYIHNSSYQKAGINGFGEKIRQCILEKLDHHLFLNSAGLTTFKIADFGCSTGPNTFDVVQSIIDTVKFKHSKDNIDDENSLIIMMPLEFQVFFNDQHNNDFNTLFSTKPPSSEYYSIGVPGSFHGQVLPRNTTHIGHTSYTIHWLSKIPEDLCDKKSIAWNKSHIHCNNLIEEVTKAYKFQFTKDMKVFLEARGEEVVQGGLMIVLGQCLPDGVSMFETWEGIVLDIIGDCLMDLVTLGLTSEEKVMKFNLPVYFPQFSEFKREIEKNKSFTIETMETISHPYEEMQLTIEFTTSKFRAILSSVIAKHFGDGVVDVLFDQLAKKLSISPIDFKKCKKQMVYCIVLKRN
ncbi:unnamed protein product [Cochlearia groenlandica]